MNLFSDEQLMQNYGQRGDVAAFDILYQRYRKPLFSFLRQKMPEAVCNEVFQDVWESLIKQADHYQMPQIKAANDDSRQQLDHQHQPFRAYLYTITRRRIADYWRSQPPNHEQDYDIEKLMANSDPELAHQQDSEKKIMLKCIAHLPKKQQDVFMLKQSGLKVTEISEVLDASFDAVKSRIRIAYQRLRECWEKIHG